MKEQDKAPGGKNPDEMVTGYLPDKVEFKVMVIKVFTRQTISDS